MNRFFSAVRHELREAVVPTIFFLVVFHTLALTKQMLLQSYQVTVTDVGVATVGALTLAKAVLIADKLAITRWWTDRPLVLSIVWKTAIHTLLCFLFRLAEELIPLASEHGGLGPAWRELISEQSWSHLLAMQIWLIMSLLAFNTVRDLDRQFGKGSVRRALFSPAGSSPAASADVDSPESSGQDRA